MSKEQIYDEKISPLMQQVIDLCIANDIPFVTSFQLTGEEDEEGPLFCTSCSLPEHSDKQLVAAQRILYDRTGGFLSMIITKSQEA